MIQLNNVSYCYQENKEGSADSDISNLSLEIPKGQMLLLTGQSGCGKTTLTRIINGLCPRFYGGILRGEYSLNGKPAQSLELHEIGQIVGSVFQDPRSQFFTMNTTDEIALGMEVNDYDRDDMLSSLLKTSSLLRIHNLLDKEIFNLSSGEKQKIAIASVCALSPDVLVFDEPSSNLDADGMTQLSTLMRRLKAMGKTIILSEHRLHYVKDIFDRLIVLESGKIIKDLPRNTALEISASDLESLGLRGFHQPKLSVNPRTRDNGHKWLSVSRLTVNGGYKELIKDTSFACSLGSVTAIIGQNGAGKSSLCRVITGLAEPSSGEILIDSLYHKKKMRLKKCFYVQQDADYQLYAPSVEDEFRIGNGKKITSDTIDACLDDVGLLHLKHRHPSTLSGGQKQRLLIALAIASNVQLLVLDEPTSGLDGSNMRRIAHLINRLKGLNRCILLITHDNGLVELTADYILHIENGQCKEFYINRN